jgi:hypothetical protein
MLAAALVGIGLVTMPAVALFLAAFLSRSGGGDPNTGEFVVFVLPALVGYPVAGALWLSARRVGDVRRAWLLAVLGVAVLIAVSFKPVVALAHLSYLQWQEYQPGGRGYHP